jgi:hypothetical protein
VLAMYQHSRPAPSHTEAFVAVDGYEEPKTVDEGGCVIGRLQPPPRLLSAAPKKSA